MKYDKFLFFSAFSADQQRRIARHFSPGHESSLFKHVPMEEMELFRHIARTINPGRRVRVRFRGPRSGAMRDYTKKCHAHSVTVYVD